MKFIKMEGLGNDFILIEDLENNFDNYSETSKKYCNRKFGIGADGLMVAKKSDTADVMMIYYNSDGSQGEMCGNGIRCFGKYIYDEGLVEKKKFAVETKAGIKDVELYFNEKKECEVKISLGKVKEKAKEIPVNLDKDVVIREKINILGNQLEFSSVLLGVPHSVIVCEDLEKIDVNEIGFLMEKDSLFPEKMNINFIEIVDKNRFRIKTWERGAGRTLACGTGCCSSAYIANKLGLVSNFVIAETEGGDLKVELNNNEIFMTGPAVSVFKGEIGIK